MGLDLRSPDHTTLSRRGQHLDCTLRRVPTRAGLHLIIDSTGLSIVGQGEWAAAKYGHRGTRGWKKLHVAVDQIAQMIHQAELVVGVGLPGPINLDRAGGLASGCVAQVRRDAAVLSLELLNWVKGPAAQAGDRRVQSPPAMSNNGKPDPASS